MTEDGKVVRLRQPEEIDDPLTAILRAGARRLLEQAIEAEVESFPASFKDLRVRLGIGMAVAMPEPHVLRAI